MSDDYFKRKKGELYHKAGNLVWLKGQAVTVEKQIGKPLGRVAKDSMWPNEWVLVDIWNNSDYVTYLNKKNGVKGKVQCPKRLQ